MIRVQFNGDKSMYAADFKTVSPDVIQLTGKKIPRNTSQQPLHPQMFLKLKLMKKEKRLVT